MKTPTLILITVLAIGNTSFALDPPPDGGYPNQNTAEGDDALFSLTTGENNTAVGFHALRGLTQNSDSTAVGYLALSAFGGEGNTAVGSATLQNNSGVDNTAVGKNAMVTNTTGSSNVAMGVAALSLNTTGGANTAIGYLALGNNTTGNLNTAIGEDALDSNTAGFWNTATGGSALSGNTTGFSNTANGYYALAGNNGSDNTGMGGLALSGNRSGNGNTALGANALRKNVSGNNNIGLGQAAGANLTTGSNNIDIGAPGLADEANTIRVGKTQVQTHTYIAGISGVTVAGGAGVVIDTTGHLGTVTSSARYKDNIQPMAKSSEAVLSLKPVTFCYKKELDPQAIPQFGLVAEQVEKVNPDLVVRDDQGKPYSVRYEAVNAMLLNEFLKEHKKVEDQANKISELESALKQQSEQMQDFAARLKANGL